ncbi:MAG: MarR family transcriptional regulator [Cytophagales bacterium CG18_big_fil_WC_8_21_14_2_50_42_9]|nr:MAG: MarR family transcriptional regulator [Cytophagales bacterium CG18_big_fil_WC_8_21_14_2_50_42_9]
MSSETREIAGLEIIDFLPAHKAAFRALNHEWISRYFELEELDHQILDHPESYILDQGGYILMARYHGEIVGTCALIKVSDTAFELGKMAVTEKAQGLKIGQQLGQAAINKAQEAGAEQLVLYSHRSLGPALHVYRKLGFKEVPCPPNGYKRADIKMTLALR